MGERKWSLDESPLLRIDWCKNAESITTGVLRVQGVVAVVNHYGVVPCVRVRSRERQRRMVYQLTTLSFCSVSITDMVSIVTKTLQLSGTLFALTTPSKTLNGRPYQVR